MLIVSYYLGNFNRLTYIAGVKSVANQAELPLSEAQVALIDEIVKRFGLSVEFDNLVTQEVAGLE